MSDIRIAITKNKKVVEINTIAFSGKRKIDWEAVEIYLKQYIGSKYVIEETGDTVYIGTDFPDEYTHSRYKEKSFGTIGKAKANATQAIPDLINTVSNLAFRRNFKGKHTTDASKGWYYGEVHFSIPITDDKKRIIGRNTFRGRMIIRKNSNEKMYLYDIIDIKKKRSSPLRHKPYGKKPHLFLCKDYSNPKRLSRTNLILSNGNCHQT